MCEANGHPAAILGCCTPKRAQECALTATEGWRTGFFHRHPSTSSLVKSLMQSINVTSG